MIREEEIQVLKDELWDLKLKDFHTQQLQMVLEATRKMQEDMAEWRDAADIYYHYGGDITKWEKAKLKWEQELEQDAKGIEEIQKKLKNRGNG